MTSEVNSNAGLEWMPTEQMKRSQRQTLNVSLRGTK